MAKTAQKYIQKEGIITGPRHEGRLRWQRIHHI